MIQAAYAQAAPVATQGGPESTLNLFFIMAVMIGIFYFMIIRPQQKKQKETDAMLKAIGKGDRVLTSGGVFGTVVGKKGEKDDVVVLKVADDVKMEFSKQSIVQVLERGE